MITFWVLSPLMVLAALGLLFARKAVHAALCLAVVMISLAMLYAAQDATFLFAVQIIVYTGAIMMLFLFVLMLVGVESRESVVEVIKGQRLAAAVLGLVFAATVVLAIGQAVSSAVVGLELANEHGNIHGLAEILFSDFVVAFQFTAALMIVAVLGAMVLAHREILVQPKTQRERADERIRLYGTEGRHPGMPPTPGVYARHNAVDMPALLPDGTPVEESVSLVIRERQQDLETRGRHDVEETLSQIEDDDLGGATPKKLASGENSGKGEDA